MCRASGVPSRGWGERGMEVLRELRLMNLEGGEGCSEEVRV